MNVYMIVVDNIVTEVFICEDDIEKEVRKRYLLNYRNLNAYLYCNIIPKNIEVKNNPILNIFISDSESQDAEE